VVVGAGPAGLEAARVLAARGHSVTLCEAADEPGGQLRIAAGLKRRREVLGIVDWRMAECTRDGVAFRFNTYAEPDDVLAEEPDLVIVATGGLPNLGFLEAGEELATTGWDILTGAAQPAASVILYDDNGGHAGMTAAELIAGTGAELEIVTPERTLAPDVGGTNYPAYFRAFAAAGVRITLNLRLESLARDGNGLRARFRDGYGGGIVEKRAAQVVVEHGTLPLDELYLALKPSSRNLGAADYRALITNRPQALVSNPDSRFQLFRIGDAVASRNIHAAVYDALRLTHVM
jgi:NADPH-dependent 2,4-dienoyl-CoA reductase/sulfur reductase-like enzyme